VNSLATLSPLLTAALGALFGAIAGAIANGRVRDRQDRQLRSQEREGLLILLDHEIEDNYSLLNILKERPEIIHSQSVGGLQTDSWDNAKVRLAQLLPRDHVDLLSSYYSRLYVLKATVGAVERAQERTGSNNRRERDSVLQRIALVLVRMAGTGARTSASRATKDVAAELTSNGPTTMKSAVADKEARHHTARQLSGEKVRERHIQHVEKAIELGDGARSKGQEYL
jgi:hypothetical protein